MSDPTVTVELTREQLRNCFRRSHGGKICNGCHKMMPGDGNCHTPDCWIGKALAQIKGLERKEGK